MTTVQKLLLALLATCCYAQVIKANVYFRFALHIGSSDGDESNNSTEPSAFISQISSLPVENNKSAETEATEAAVEASVERGIAEAWSRQKSLNQMAVDKLQSTQQAIANVNREILPLVGRSDYIAAKVKLTTRYLNEVDAAAGQRKFENLRQFVELVEALQQAPSAQQGGNRSLEFLLMKLVLDKYDVPQLQTQVRQELLQGELAWQKYVKSRLVEVAA